MTELEHVRVLGPSAVEQRAMTTGPVLVRRRRADMRAELAKLMDEGQGPFLSLYLDVSPGAHRTSARDRLEALVEQGRLTRAQSNQVGDVLLNDRHESDQETTLAALFGADGRHFITSYPHPPRHEVVLEGNLPYLAPLLYAEQALSHHVIAVVATTRLEMLTVPRHGTPAEASYSIDDTMSVASVIQRVCRLSRTTLLLLCGPGPELDELADQVASGLAVDTSLMTIATDGLEGHQLSAEIGRATATRSAERTVELLRLWRFHHSQGEAVTGLVDTMTALSERRCALLLVHDDPADERHAWFGPEPYRIASDMEHATPINPDERLLEARLTDVVIRAALVGGFPVHIVPSVESTLDDGLGVILADRTSPQQLAELLEL